MTTLGIDYGAKRIGVAVAETGLAEPVGIVANDATAVGKIKQLAKRYQAELVVVGITAKSQEFGSRLKQAGLPITWHDETLSSQEATVKLKHKSSSFRSKPQDAYQAAVMLQDWLDSQPIPTPSVGEASRA